MIELVKRYNVEKVLKECYWKVENIVLSEEDKKLLDSLSNIRDEASLQTAITTAAFEKYLKKERN